MVLLADADVQDLDVLLPDNTSSADSGPEAARHIRQSEAEELFHRIVREGESFWEAVHAPFLSRDLTREQLRQLIRQGLAVAQGNYKELVELFNMPSSDYTRFLSFVPARALLLRLGCLLLAPDVAVDDKPAISGVAARALHRYDGVIEAARKQDDRVVRRDDAREIRD